MSEKLCNRTTENRQWCYSISNWRKKMTNIILECGERKVVEIVLNETYIKLLTQTIQHSQDTNSIQIISTPAGRFTITTTE